MILSTLNNITDQKSWTHGGDGSGYKSYMNAYKQFNDTLQPLDSVFKAFSFGYVRPAGKWDSYNNRKEVVHQIYDIIKNDDHPQGE